MDDLILQVRRQAVGDTVTLRIVRGGQKLDVRMRIGDKPANVTGQNETTRSPHGKEATPTP
jgi:S1-C subfamily serine protease